MDFGDSTNRMLAHLALTPDAYLLGNADFSSPFTLLDKATLENRRPDSLWAIPGEVVQRLEQAGLIVRFGVSDKTQIGFRTHKG
jgi:hypothetical protein